MKALSKFLALDWHHRFLLLEAGLYLAAARAALWSIPFRWIAPHLGQQALPAPATTGRGQELSAARQVTEAVERLARYTPWDSTCLVQCVAGKFMLRRRGYPSWLILGLKKEEGGKLAAHAWLQSGNEILLGGGGHEAYTALGGFGESVLPRSR